MTTAPTGSNQDPYTAPKANVWMPEVAGAGGPVKAERLTRLGAYLIDYLSLTLAFLPFCLILIYGVLGSAVEGRESVPGVVVLGIVLGSLLALGFCILQLVLLARSSQTLGKKLLNIRIVRKDGSPASFGRIFGLRMVLTWVLGIIPMFQLVDICFIFGEEKRCVHDLIADTIVVRV